MRASRARASWEPEEEPSALLVRLVVVRGWTAGLPPVPDGRMVTVSFSHAAAAARYRSALTRRGYRVVGALQAARDVAPWADVLVDRSIADAHPAFWRQLQTCATRVFNLRFGPVRMLLTEVLALHAADAR